MVLKKSLTNVFSLLVAVLSVLHLSCGRQSEPPKQDTTPPVVISIYPGNNSINASITTSISIGFSEEMDATTIGPTTILVSDTDSNPVQGDVSCNVATVTFKPGAALEYSRTYVVTITEGVRDKAENNISSPVTFFFKTGAYQDLIPPQVFSTAPTGTHVGVNAAMSVTFNEDMLPSTITSQSITVSDGTINIPGQVQHYGDTVLFLPADQLSYRTTYTVTVAGTVADLSGNQLGLPYNWQFTTQEPIPDTTPPTVLTTVPTASANDVPVTTLVVAAFDESIMTTSVTSTTMMLNKKNVLIPIAGSVSAVGTIAVMAPSSRLDYDTDYLITLVPGYTGAPGIRDLAGNLLVSNSPSGYTWAFRTEPVPNHTIVATAGIGGSISPSGNVLVSDGGSRQFTITPATGYHIDDVLVDGSSVGAMPSYTFTSVQANHTISATFAINAYTVSATAGANGTISPASRLVSHGSTTTFTVTPNGGYSAVISGTCGGALVGNTYTTNTITNNCTVIANFSINTFTITPSAGSNGSISPATVQTVNYGATPTFTITPTTGYHIDDVLVDGSSVGAMPSYTFTSVQATHTISATFAINIYTVATTVDYDYRGNITPGSRLVNYGDTTTFTVTTYAGFTATVNGTCGGSIVFVGPSSDTYTTNAITGDCTVAATFAITN